MKLRTARTLKWNTLDRVSTQVLYAVTGIVLANTLSKESFGLVGALLVFQAFAILFVDSGFGAALLQKKEPSERDYSTVFWFNLAVSIGVYVLLFLCAPLIADIFRDRRLIPLSRVMFATFVLNGLSIVQTNRLMKMMDVKMIAVSNIVALAVSGALGIFLAVKGAEAWALVWQSVSLAGVKSAWLWISTRWVPRAPFSTQSLKGIWRVGLGVFSSSFLNTLWLNIYSFIIGAFYSLGDLGIYTQADKWSKMGSASLSQIFTSSFVPLMAAVQDNRAHFHRYMKKVNALAAFITFPLLGALTVLAPEIFHTLFGNKWDEAIILFRILAARGILIVLVQLYTNYLLALGYAKSLVTVEIIKDSMIAVAIAATVWSGSMEALVWGQLAASAITFIIMVPFTSRATGYGILPMLTDNAPFLLLTLLAGAAAWLVASSISAPIASLAAGAIAGAIVYWSILKIFRSEVLLEAEGYLFGRFRNKLSSH